MVERHQTRDRCTTSSGTLKPLTPDPMGLGKLSRDVPGLHTDVGHRDDFPERAAGNRSQCQQMRVCAAVDVNRFRLRVHVDSQAMRICADMAAGQQESQQ